MSSAEDDLSASKTIADSKVFVKLAKETKSGASSPYGSITPRSTLRSSLCGGYDSAYSHIVNPVVEKPADTAPKEEWEEYVRWLRKEKKRHLKNEQRLKDQYEDGEQVDYEKLADELIRYTVEEGDKLNRGEGLNDK